MKRIACILATGFEETEAITTVDMLRRAGFIVDFVSLDQKEVQGSHQITIIADRLWGNDLKDYNMLFLPGGQPGTNNLMADSRVIELVQEFDRQSKWIAAICAAPMVLAFANIIEDRTLTSYPDVHEGLIFKKARYVNDPVVIDQHIITSRGVGTVLPFAMACVDCLGGDSETLKKSVLYSSS